MPPLDPRPTVVSTLESGSIPLLRIAKADLIALDDDLAYVLREADRLWMVSQEGLEKDLFDDPVKRHRCS